MKLAIDLKTLTIIILNRNYVLAIFIVLYIFYLFAFLFAFLEL